jgi:hypothetical protein
MNQASTRLTFQPVQVTLVQGSNFWVGSGVYHAFSDDVANLPASALLAFSAVDRSGSTRFFQATLTPGAGLPTAPTVGLPTIPQGAGYSGAGTHCTPTSPQAAVAWRIQSSTAPPVMLTDATGEPHTSRSVVANAIRLTPVR